MTRLEKTIKMVIKEYGVRPVIDAIANVMLDTDSGYKVEGSSWRGYKQIHDKLKEI